MKIEIPFRGIAMKNLRHRFIKLLYENACKVEPDYTKLIHFVKVHIGLCISLPDTRQLVLYSSLFGVTENFCAPNAEDTLRVIKSCPLAVPPFINFKKWSRDVKRMEGNPLSADVTKVKEDILMLFIHSLHILLLNHVHGISYLPPPPHC